MEQSGRKYIAELLGTFGLLLTIVLCVNSEAIPVQLAPALIGFILMILIYVGGPISNAHYNPAVTVGFILRKRIKRADVFGYVVAQLAGAVIAAFLGVWILGKEAEVEPFRINQMALALLGEFLGTFVLVTVILSVATLRRTQGNQYYGFVIGATVSVLIYSIGWLSGGAYNPAAALGCSVANMLSWTHLVPVSLACFAGGGLAGVVFNALDREQVSQDLSDHK